MTLNKLQYRNKPVHFEVVELTASNIKEVASWCGGRIEHIQNVMNSSLTPTSIGVPSLYGAISAEIGSFVARDTNTGRFSVMTREHLESEYERFGLRQNGPFPRLGDN